MAFSHCKKFLIRYSCQFISRKSHSEIAAEVADKVCGNKSKLAKDPFMKNIFCGKVDRDLLYFPEVEMSDLEGTDTETKPLQLESKAIVGDESNFSRLHRSGVCGMGVPTEFGGTPLNATSYLRIVEKLDIAPVTAYLLEAQYSLIIETLLKYGSFGQKQKYLKDVVTGSILGSYALHEDLAGSDPASVECTATPVEFSDDSTYSLTGEKTWISNASTAKFFIVFAQYRDLNKSSESKLLSAFIVDKDSPGITLEKQESLLNECDICRVKFDNVVLPHNSILGNVGSGYEIAVSNLESSKFIFISSILNLIRKLLSQVSAQVARTDRFPLPLMDLELVQYRLSRVAAILYALESSVYFLAGMKDLYLIDTSFESVILQNLVYSYGLYVINECFSLAGTKAHEADYSSELENLQLLVRSFSPPEIYNLYISLKGIEFAGKTMSETVKQIRNPLNFPSFIFKRILQSRGQAADSPKLRENLYMEYHPSLKASADRLEYCIYRLQYGLETLLSHHGTETVNRQLDLKRLSEVACDIFSMIAVLARASRSYCTGIRHYDEEVMTANAWSQETMKRVKMKVLDIVEGETNLSDYALLKLAPHIFRNKGYFFTCPSERNIT